MIELVFTEPPPGVNNLYANVPGRGRVSTPEAKAWRFLAGHELNRQRPDHVSGPVKIDIAVADQGRGDLDGKAKIVLDLLVTHCIIEDDDRSIVREIHMTWDKSITGCRVTIEALANGKQKD